MSLVHFNITIWKIASVIRSSEQLCIFLKLAWHVNFRLERNRYFQDGNWTMKLNPDLACFLTPSTKGLIFNVVIALWWPILEFHEQKADSWEITGIPKNFSFCLPTDYIFQINVCMYWLFMTYIVGGEEMEWEKFQKWILNFYFLIENC